MQVGEEYPLSTFDLGGCMKDICLIWKLRNEYKKHAVTVGPFHTGMNKCRGSGYSEILTEAQLVTNGCLSNVLTGKAYVKAPFRLKIVSEAKERLLIEQFFEKENIDFINLKALSSPVQRCDWQNFDHMLQDFATITVFDKYVTYKEKVRKGHLGRTATFWLSVIDHARLNLILLQ